MQYDFILLSVLEQFELVAFVARKLSHAYRWISFSTWRHRVVVAICATFSLMSTDSSVPTITKIERVQTADSDRPRLQLCYVKIILIYYINDVG